MQKTARFSGLDPPLIWNKEKIIGGVETFSYLIFSKAIDNLVVLTMLLKLYIQILQRFNVPNTINFGRTSFRAPQFEP